MNQKKASLPTILDLPEVQVSEKTRFPVVWVVPLLAAAVAGWLIFQNVRQAGSVITILFHDGKGLQAGQTVIKYRGVRAGDVRRVQLTKDGKYVEVEARLDRSASNLAREGALFWIVRPEISAGTLRGLETLVGGSYIQVRPGRGKEKRKFLGVEKAPAVKSQDEGLDILVTTSQLGSLTAGSPVYYRGVEVGMVQDYTLGDDATKVNLQVHVEPRFAPLVRADSKFWNAGGLKLDLNLFGLDVSAESFKSLVVGGIAFATPWPLAPVASPGSAFPLHEKAEDKWLKWSPAIPLTEEQ